MDRFELSVNQVNFEGNDLEQFSSIHSFGNLVSYDSDLKNADPTSEPVMAKRVLEDAYQDGKASGSSEFAELPGLVEHNFEGYLAHSYSMQGQKKVVETHQASESTAFEVEQSCDSISDVSPEAPHLVTEPRGEEVTRTQMTTDDVESLRSPTAQKMFGLDASIDTFHAFTKTVEALALQESVIDNKNITPASPADVARAIAEAQQKLSNSQTEPLHQDRYADNVVSVVISDDNLSSMSGITPTASVSSGTDDGSDVALSDRGDMSRDTMHSSLNGANVASPVHERGGGPGTVQGHVHEGNNLAVHDEDCATVELSLGDHELIRIPSDQMIRMTQTSSWFSRVTSSSAPMSSASEWQQVAPPSSGDDLQVAQTTDDGAVAMTTRQDIQAGDENGCATNEDGLIVGEKPEERLDNGVDVDHSDHGQVTQPQTDDIPKLTESQQVNNSKHANSSINNEESHIEAVAPVRPYSSSTSLQPSSHSTPKHSSVRKSSSEELHASDVSQTTQQADALGAGDNMTRHGSHDDHVTRSWSLDSVGQNSSGLDAVRGENAKLEGQLEILHAEAKASLAERAQLHAQIATLTQQLKVEESSKLNVVSERDDLAADLETLRQNRGRLEQIILDAHRLLEEKDEDRRVIQEDLVLSQETRDKLSEKLKLAKEDAEAKDDAVRVLKEKVAELYVEFQTTNQNKILVEQEVKSLQNEVSSLIMSKEWYQEQLLAAQEAKSTLQSDLTKVKGEVIAHTTHVERLRAENVRVKQQLNDTQKRLIQDKQMLARHLEAIEADMMEREATFMQIRCERDSVEQVLQSQMAKSSSTVAMDETVEELNKLKAELKRRQAQIGVLENEHSELVKRLALSQESILERDRSIENLETASIDAEIQVKQIRLELNTKDEELLQVKEAKNSLDVALRAARDEKRVFDDALQTLKEDMSKVGQNFMQLKQELKQKKEEIFRLKARKNRISEKLVSSAESDSVTEQQDSNDDSSAITMETLELMKNAVEDELAELRVSSQSELEQLRATVSTLENDLANVRSQLKTTQMEATTRGVEKENMKSELEVVRGRLSEMQMELQSLREKNISLDTEVLRASSSRTTDMEVTEQMKAENDDLRSKLGQLQSDSHRAIAKQKAKALKLGKDLEMLLKEQRAQQVTHQAEVADLTERLQLSEESSKKLAAEVSTLQGRFSLDLDEKTQALQEEMEQMKKDLQASKDENQILMAKLRTSLKNTEDQEKEYRHEVEALEKELLAAQEYVEQQRETYADSQQLSLDLEREKGRLAGVLQSHATLKEHCCHLEAQLAANESSVVVQNSEVLEKLAEREKELAQVEELVRSLDEEVKRERENAKESKKQLMKEKGAHIKLRRQMETVMVDHDQLQATVDQTTRELSGVKTDLQRAQESQQKYKNEAEHVTVEYQNVRVEMERLQQSLENKEQKDSVYLEEVKSLKWQLDELRNELEAAREKLHLVEERHKMEVESLQTALQGSVSELAAVREELLTVRQEKSSLHAKLTELRTAVKTSVQKNKNVMTDSSHPPFDMEAIERLLKESSSITKQSKPLTFLQATLSTLRGDITGLQEQVNEHTLAVQTSSQSWREVEEQVKDLREVIRSSAASREATHQAGTVDGIALPPGVSFEQPVVPPVGEKSAQMNETTTQNGADVI